MTVVKTSKQLLHITQQIHIIRTSWVMDALLTKKKWWMLIIMSKSSLSKVTYIDMLNCKSQSRTISKSRQAVVHIPKNHVNTAIVSITFCISKTKYHFRSQYLGVQGHWILTETGTTNLKISARLVTLIHLLIYLMIWKRVYYM